jgi:hypothetical protein
VDLERYDRRANLIRRYILRKIRIDTRSIHSALWKLLSSVESAQTFIDEFQATGLYGGDSTAPIFSRIRLHTIAKYGMWLIYREFTNQQEQLIAMLWGLSLIGITKHLWLHQGICEFCFRRTWPGRRFCQDHTQSQSDDVTRSANYMRYRIGKKAHQLAIKHAVIERIQGSAMMKHDAAATAMSHLLFPEIIDEEAKTEEKDMVFIALSKCPRVLRRIRHSVNISYDDFINISYDKLVNILRQTLDPYELSYIGWSTKIFAAEIWFSAEAKVAPGKRKQGKKTSARISVAKKLAAAGYSKSEIAEKLGISPSTISKWIARKPELSQFFS